MPQEKEN